MKALQKYMTAKEIAVLNKAIKPLEYSIKESNPSTTIIIVRSAGNARVATKINIEKILKTKVKIESVRAGGSTGATDVFFKDHKIRITYKPISGGMSETTLNSTITELAPALAFMNGKKKFKNHLEFYDFLKTAKNNGVYVGSDEKAGKAFIKTMPTSSKFQVKLENAMGILDYLWAENVKSPIKQVYWGYRAKPAGISVSHKGDLFIEYKNKNMLGVSLKAGSDTTKEPQFNTFVHKFFDVTNNTPQKLKLIDNVYKKIHSQIDLSPDWYFRGNKSAAINVIEDFRLGHPSKYDTYYDQMLEMIRAGLISQVNRSMPVILKYIKEEIIGKDDKVPLVVIKATGKRYIFVTDEDRLDLFLPSVSKVKAYKSTSSKQNWFIELSNKKETITMLMSVRSNKAIPHNKIAQGTNLAIKFNGIK